MDKKIFHQFQKDLEMVEYYSSGLQNKGNFKGVNRKLNSLNGGKTHSVLPIYFVQTNIKSKLFEIVICLSSNYSEIGELRRGEFLEGELRGVKFPKMIKPVIGRKNQPKVTKLCILEMYIIVN